MVISMLLLLLSGICTLWAIGFAGLVVLVLILALTGKTLGIRALYIKFLRKVFAWASKTIKEAEREEGQGTDDAGYGSEQEDHDEGPRRQSIHVIQKEATGRIMRKLSTGEPHQSQVVTYVRDSYDLMKAAMEAIIEDEVTSRFNAAELAGWNLLSRRSHGYEFINYRLTLVWCLGLVFRYLILFPVRFVIQWVGVVYLLVCTYLVGLVPDGPTKRKLHWYVSITYNRILCRAVSVVVTYHNPENKAKPGGICVANHTSPLDVTVLSMDNCYALVGQKQGGLLGLIQRAQNRATSNIWFERAEANDRAAVTRRLREHVEDPNKLPILIFPEGTCINNTSIMMFKKGSFEVGGIIYPAAIKYDVRLGDAFWNSSKQSYLQYTLMLMTSWATVADVYYLPPMTRREGESGIDFAARVKHVIAEAGGLVELDWDGMLKRDTVKPQMVDKQRERYSRRIIASGKMDKIDDAHETEGGHHEEAIHLQRGPNPTEGITKRKAGMPETADSHP